MKAATRQRQLAFLRQHGALVLAMAVGGLGGVWLGERAPVRTDAWFAEAVQGLRGGDAQRALFAVEHHLFNAPRDAAALIMRERLRAELDCQRDMAQAEHALVNGDRTNAALSFERVDTSCRQHRFAVTRLEQIGAR